MQQEQHKRNPAKVYLQRYRWLKKEKDTLAAEVRELYASATRITASTDGIKVQSSGIYDKMAENVVRAADAAARLTDAERRIDDQLRDILSLIDGLSDERYRAVLLLRYIRCESWVKISMEMDYQEAQIYRLHGKALKELNEILETREKQPE